MKINRIFIIGILLFLALMFWIEYNLPKNFIWNPTFNQYDAQPFGSKIFDDVVSHSYPDGYSVSRETFYQFLDDTLDRKSFLVVEDYLNLGEVDVNAVMKLAEAGNKIMLVSRRTGKRMADTLNVGYTYGSFNIRQLKKSVTESPIRDSILWLRDSAFNERYFEFYPQLLPNSIIAKDTLSEILAVRNKPSLAEFSEYLDSVLYRKDILALSRKVGKGEIILVSTPLIFTNYGMLDKDNAAYIFRLLSKLKGYPLVRTEGYSHITIEQQSPLRYLLANPPLKWALYLGMLLILLFMIFTAKRKQRAIPIIKAPDNKSLEFTRLIGTLYYHKKDYTGLVRMNYTLMSENLRRLAHIDLENDDEPNLFERISEKTGLDTDKIAKFFNRLHGVIHNNITITDNEMRNLIDGMNKIIKLIRY